MRLGRRRLLLCALTSRRINDASCKQTVRKLLPGTGDESIFRNLDLNLDWDDDRNMTWMDGTILSNLASAVSMWQTVHSSLEEAVAFLSATTLAAM